KVFRRNSLKSIKYAGPCEKGTFCDGDHSASARVAVSSLRRRRTSCQAPPAVVQGPMSDRGAPSLPPPLPKARIPTPPRLMFKKWERALERLSKRIGVMNVAQPSSTDIPDLLQRLIPLPIRAKQLKRQKESLFTTLLRRFHIVLVYGFLQFEKHK